ncbi:MAG: hypothetical protein Q8N98_04800, partial [bacterium]|nr:hypothetical protein [bacterium]
SLRSRHGWAGTITAANLTPVWKETTAWDAAMPGAGMSSSYYYLDGNNQRKAWTSSTFNGTAPAANQAYGEPEQIVYLVITTTTATPQLTRQLRIQDKPTSPDYYSPERTFTISQFALGGITTRLFKDENENGRAELATDLVTTELTSGDYQIQYNDPKDDAWKNFAGLTLSDGCSISAVATGSASLPIPADLGGKKYKVRLTITTQGEAKGWKTTGGYYVNPAGLCLTGESAETLERGVVNSTQFNVNNVSFDKNGMKNIWFGVVKKAYTVTMTKVSGPNDLIVGGAAIDYDVTVKGYHGYAGTLNLDAIVTGGAWPANITKTWTPSASVTLAGVSFAFTTEDKIVRLRL